MPKAKKIKEIPYISVKQMIEVDRLMIDYYGISLIQMMENAGRNLAEFVTNKMAIRIVKPHILVMVGSRGNGGGDMVAARHLSSKGFNVDVVFSTRVKDLMGVIKHKADILTKLPVNIFEEKLPTQKYNLIIDGIIGYSLKGEPRGFAKRMIEFCNNSTSKVVSLDTPSGLKLNGNITNNSIVKADFTMTLALPKTGLKSDKANEYVGRLFLADISVPPNLYAKIDVKIPSDIFKEGYLVEILK